MCYRVVAIAAVALVIVFIGGMLVTYLTVVVPTKKATQELGTIVKGIAEKEGDLTKRVKERTKDEAGQLVAGITQFIGTLQRTISEIKQESTAMMDNVETVTGQIGKANENITDVSATMQQLADSSRETANNIQEISVEVTESVNLLADNANKMVDFISDVVMPDYDKLVNTGNAYSNDANEFERILHDFEDGASRLTETMESVKSLVGNISVTISECSDGVNTVAENAGHLTDGMSRIQSEVMRTKDSADNLVDNIDMFKYV